MGMDLFVRYKGGKLACRVSVEVNDTITELKAAVAKEMNIDDVEEFVILGPRHKPLTDKYTLCDYNIQRESDVYFFWNKRYLKQKRIKNSYVHKPNTNNCPFMKNDEEKHKSCPVYEKMKRNKGTQKDLEHMELYIHANVELPQCEYGTKCKSYQRTLNGNNTLNDQCHLRIFGHPPRMNLSYHPFKFVSGYVDENIMYNYAEIVPQIQEAQAGLKLDQQTEDKLLELLINEIKNNGFANDLNRNKNKSLLDVAKEKLKHPRHIAMKSPLKLVEMFSIVLYTEASCNYDLCKNQRDGNFKKWVIFDYVLDQAITKLAAKEYGDYPVYSGVSNVMIDFTDADTDGNIPYKVGYLCTFTSTSWDINVAKQFCGSKGIIVEFSSNIRKYGCDVSWISKYPEKEILFSRAYIGGRFKFKCHTNSRQYILFQKIHD
eukprot:489380_1